MLHKYVPLSNVQACTQVKQTFYCICTLLLLRT